MSNRPSRTSHEYLYDLGDRLVAEIGPSSKLVSGNIYAGGLFLAEDGQDGYENGNGTMLRIADQVGTVRGRFDVFGNWVNGCASLPFGDSETCGGPSVGDMFFTGKLRDTDTSFDDLGARDYSSLMGRFMSPDPLFISTERLLDPQLLNLYSYVRNNPLSLTDPTGLDFYMQCAAGNRVGCVQVSIDPNHRQSKQWVQADANGNATIVTSASLSDSNSGNTATVNGNGVMITSSTGTAQGIFINGTPSATIQGDSNSPGWSQFSFHIDSNDVAHGVLSAGEAMYNGPDGYQGMVDAIKKLRVNGNGPFTYPEEMFGNPKHPDAIYNLRFSSGAHPDLFDYGPSPHFPVPHSGTTTNFHVDSRTGPMHLPCALMGVGCY